MTGAAADRHRRPHRHREERPGTRRRRAAWRRDRQRRRHAAVPRDGHRHRQAAARRAARHAASPARRARRHRDRDGRPLPEAPPATTSRRSWPAARCRSSSAARCSTSSPCSTTGVSRPPIREVRARWEATLAEVGVAALHAELARVDADAAASILPTDGRRIVRALEVVELTGPPVRGQRAQRSAQPRWDTVIIGLDWDTDASRRPATSCGPTRCSTTAWSTRCARCRRRGLRDGVDRRRVRSGYAQVLAALDAGGGADDLAEARERTFIGTRRYVRRQRSWFRRDHRIRWLDGAAPGNAGRGASSCCATYPEQVMFAKGHGTENDFVLLPDVDARRGADPRRGRRPVRPPPRPRRRRRAAGHDGRCRAGSGRFRPDSRGRRRRRLVHGLPQRRRIDRRRCAATASGCSRTTCGPAGSNGATSSSSAPWPARARSSCTTSTPCPPTSPSTWARPTSSAPARRSWADDASADIAVDVGNPHLACVDASLTAADLAALDVAAPVSFDAAQFPEGSTSRC